MDYCVPVYTFLDRPFMFWTVQRDTQPTFVIPLLSMNTITFLNVYLLNACCRLQTGFLVHQCSISKNFTLSAPKASENVGHLSDVNTSPRICIPMSHLGVELLCNAG